MPFYIDGDTKLSESRVISMYLVAKYGGADSPLYPSNDLEKRIQIDRLLYFDVATLIRSYSDYFVSSFKTDTINSAMLNC